MKKGTRADRRRKRTQLSRRVCSICGSSECWRLFRGRDPQPQHHALDLFDAIYASLVASLAEYLSKPTSYSRVNPPGTIDLIKTPDGTYK